jgi:uncharacterized protein (DUF433 family)
LRARSDCHAVCRSLSRSKSFVLGPTPSWKAALTLRRSLVETIRRELELSTGATPIIGAVTLADFDRITVDPEVLGGKACVRGLRISVGMIVQMVAAGKSTEQIIDEYPYLEAEDVRQALAYSAHLAESEYHLALRPPA